MAPFEDSELLPEHQIFKQKARARPEDSKNATEEETERSEHASVLSWLGCGKQPLLISKADRVLANNRSHQRI
jgi:hypothetical protein